MSEWGKPTRDWSDARFGLLVGSLAVAFTAGVLVGSGVGDEQQKRRDVVDGKGRVVGEIRTKNGEYYEVYDPKSQERKAYGIRSTVNPNVIEFYDAKSSKRTYEIRERRR